MSRSIKAGLPTRRPSAIVAVTVAALATTAAVAPSGAASAAGREATGRTVTGLSRATAPAYTDGHYLVTLADQPAATYTGGVSGFAATKAQRGKKFDAASTDVRKYRALLEKRQKSLLDSVKARATYQYSLTSNGFAAQLSGAQAAKLARTPGVLAVTKDVERKMLTTETPGFLGLTGKGGVWDRIGGSEYAGKGVVVGVLDSGYWPENPFFAGTQVNTWFPQPMGVPYRDKATRQIAMKKADGGTFLGACEAGVKFPASTCNSKVLSARAYPSGFLANVKRDDWSPFEQRSPRDGDGHGSHTASTAVGNQIPELPIQGADFGAASGMAPAAKLAVYKVCWDDRDENTGGCYNSDIVKAIDQAVADGVDVINFSISGALDTVVDPVELAFLRAAAAGVFVAASAGNEGPSTSSVNHPSPWLTTVAAGTVHHFYGTVVLGDGTKVRGASINRKAVASAPLVLSSNAVAPGAKADEARLCAPGTLDPAKVKGAIVVCIRGVVARVDKSKAVAQAGGVGMVLVNPTPNSLDADVHSVPTVHLDDVTGKKVLDYAAAAQAPTASIVVGDTTGAAPDPVPQIAAFSSRGPSLANSGDIIKPDLAAPGVSILAAVAPGPFNGEPFAPESGTSMASPHVAGLGALLASAHPDWSPMAIKSALMTSANDTYNATGGKNNDPFQQGAGFVRPRGALDPGLIYDSGPADWLGFLEGIGLDTESGVEPISASDLNQASIAAGNVVTSATVKRTVTSTGAGTFKATASVPGFTTTVTPSTLTFTKAGETASFTVTFTRTTAKYEQWASGFLLWTSGATRARSPIALRPVSIAAPAEVHADASASGTTTFTATPAGSTPVSVSVKGLVKGDVATGSVAAGGLTDPAATKAFPLTIPEGTSLTRLDLVAGDEGDDLDMFLTDTDGTVLLNAATGAASERADILAPPPGDYLVKINGFDVKSGDTASFTLRTFNVPGSSAGNLTVDPSSLPGTSGKPVEATLTWKGLDASAPYLGWLKYSGSGTPTIVSIG
ncbi:MAG: S8 family peptidase [Kineosporiaceae bacterium]